MDSGDIDRAIVDVLADGQWRKVAYVLASLRLSDGSRVDDIHERLRVLVALGALESKGDISGVGTSEVRRR